MARLPNAPISDAAIRAAFMMEAPKPRFDNAASVRAAKISPRKPPKATLSAYKPSLGERIESGISDMLGGGSYARHFAGRAIAPLNDVTPVGNMTGAADAGTTFRQGITQGDVAKMALGAGAFGLSVLPMPGQVRAKAKRGLADLMRDESGAIRAWHGSPHDFDKFSMDKIGTGEGAQAYGHGLYFAENKAVAEDYRKVLGHRANATDDPASLAEFWKQMNGGDAQATVRTLQTMKDQKQRIIDRAAKGLPLAPGAEASALEEIRKADLALAHLASGAEPPVGGRLYEVNIDAEPDQFLDYDAPLIQQPKAMNALKALNLDDTAAMSKTRKMLEWAQQGTEQPHNMATGRELLNAISGYGDNRLAEHDALRPFGLEGVRYLDQGSRDIGQGSRNFVVFDDKLVNILNKF
jgi:hypothetical protein